MDISTTPNFSKKNMTEAKIEPTTFIMIEKIKHLVKITNKSDFDVIVSYRPQKPKRKYKDSMLVRKGYFVIDEYDIDLSKVSISFHNGEQK